MKKQFFSALALSLGAAALFLNVNEVSQKEASSLKISSVLKVYAREDSGSESGGENGSGESAGGKGWGYSTSQIQCASPQYDATVATQVNSGSGAGVEVQAGGIIPGTSITAGVTGTYFTSAGSTTITTQKSPTTKDVCVSASWYNYCGGAISCRYIAG